MALLFHQNMRVYGGNTPARNLAYQTSFLAINAATAAAGPYLAAGFTEIMNSNTAPGALQMLAGALDPGLTRLVLIGVGTTSVGCAKEFIGIATNPAFVTTHVGCVLRDSVRGGWRVYWWAFPAIVPTTFPEPERADMEVDSRGVAFVAGTRAGGQFVIGFMHNMYNEGNKTGAFSDLGKIAKLIRDKVPGYGGAEVIFGGDFNVEPRQPTQRGALPMQAICAVNGAGARIRTTATHTYDFWLVSNAAARTDAHCTVHNQTMGLNCSDHYGVGIRGLP